MEPSFTYRNPGRRPLTVFAGAIVMFLLWLALTNGAPWYIWAIWVPTAAATTWMLVANPVSGMTMDDTTLLLSPEHRPQAIRLDHILWVDLSDWCDGPGMHVWLRDGTDLRVFTADIPSRSALTSALTNRGIALAAPVTP